MNHSFTLEPFSREVGSGRFGESSAKLDSRPVMIQKAVVTDDTGRHCKRHICLSLTSEDSSAGWAERNLVVSTTVRCEVSARTHSSTMMLLFVGHSGENYTPAEKLHLSFAAFYPHYTWQQVADQVLCAHLVRAGVDHLSAFKGRRLFSIM